MKYLYTGNSKRLINKLKKTQIKDKISHVHGLKQYCLNVYTTQNNLQVESNPYQNSFGSFYINKTILIRVVPQVTPNAQSKLEKEQN